jgi:hypothetical protein
MSLARRRPHYSSVAAARDLDMRADILRIAAMKNTIRLKASVGPVGEGDITQRFGLSMIDACRLLNGMVADSDITAGARKRPDWFEYQAQRQGESVTETNWRERFAETHWNYFESLSWATYLLPEKLHAITSSSRRSSVFYGTDQSDRLRKEFWREWRLGTIKAFIRGAEVLPAAAVDPRIIEDIDLVFQASTILAKWPAESSKPIDPKLPQGTDIGASEHARTIAIADRIMAEAKNGKPAKGFGKEAIATYLNKHGDFGGLEALRDTWDAVIGISPRGRLTHETYTQIVGKAELILGVSRH